MEIRRYVQELFRNLPSPVSMFYSFAGRKLYKRFFPPYFKFILEKQKTIKSLLSPDILYAMKYGRCTHCSSYIYIYIFQNPVFLRRQVKISYFLTDHRKLFHYFTYKLLSKDYENQCYKLFRQYKYIYMYKQG